MGTRKHLDKIRKVKPDPGAPREKKEHGMTPDEKKALFIQVVREDYTSARVYKEENIQDDPCEEALALLIEIPESIARGDDDNVTPTPYSPPYWGTVWRLWHYLVHQGAVFAPVQLGEVNALITPFLLKKG